MAVTMAVVLGACSASQDPGISPPTSAGTSTTSHALLPCPPGGPDSTTPSAGCLDAGGSVVRP